MGWGTGGTECTGVKPTKRMSRNLFARSAASPDRTRLHPSLDASLEGALKYLQQLNISTAWLLDFMQRAFRGNGPSLRTTAEKDRRRNRTRQNFTVVHGRGPVMPDQQRQNGSLRLTIIPKRK